jgi:hypothetical protein
VATDLIVDASGNSLVLIDHMYDKVYRVDGDALVLIGNVPLKADYPLGTQFTYDADAKTLSAIVNMDDIAAIQGNNVTLTLNNQEKLSIAFDKPLAGVEQVVTDANGIIWLLYSQEGDYRMRRVARVDRTRGTVGVAEIDVWFPFDATRHMAATGNGVVVFGGDQQEGRLISFDYTGAGL